MKNYYHSSLFIKSFFFESCKKTKARWSKKIKANNIVDLRTHHDEKQNEPLFKRSKNSGRVKKIAVQTIHIFGYIVRLNLLVTKLLQIIRIEIH